MKFTLKDYQEDAVSDVLERLRRARRRWREDNEVQAFSLTAPTGAGKTIMAAAVFEALFHGDDTFEFDADPGAVVIWFSDDPSLNEQTRFRLGEASDRLNWTDLHVVENSFNREKLAPGKVYFLNTHKLSRNSLLVRGHEPEDEAEPSLPDMRPDARSFTIWDTIRNTIEDPALTLYLVLDEAHRGMGEGRTLQDRSTIVRRLINGAGSMPPMPIVWGISATVERFNVAMREARGRSILPGVAVDPAKVQESGLLKDTIVLDIPDEAGHFETVLVRRATDKIVESSQAWADYAAQQPGTPVVQPLLVLQVRNTPNPDEIGRALDMIYERWPDLSQDAIAHVFGEHVTQTFGRHMVPYISPERVQESAWIRVLIAKDAISTGWDCPRAEVMVSFRAAQDPTHITQLLGRMVRTPLARRIPGNDKLNSVDCLLPFFDRVAVKAVADALMAGGGDGEQPLSGRRVLINPAEMMPNPSVAADAWARFLSLPSQSLPHRAPRPVKRLTALAHELATDGILADAGKEAHREMHAALDAARVRYASQLEAARQSVLTVEGVALTADLRERVTRFNAFVESADMAVIDDAYRRAARVFSPDLARTYAEHLARNMPGSDPEEALIAAHVEIAALTLVEGVREYLETEAERRTRQWLDQYRIAIKSLGDERQEEYRQIRAMSAEPEAQDLGHPREWLVASMAREQNGDEIPLPRYRGHLMCDAEGLFPAELNGWEQAVLDRESARVGFEAWYRNPARATPEALGIAYESNGGYKILRPDFLFLSRLADGTVVADLVDPHGTQLSDALPKIRGLAQYAETHAGAFRRIESVAKVDDELKFLDLTDRIVRNAIATAESAAELFQSALARAY